MRSIRRALLIRTTTGVAAVFCVGCVLLLLLARVDIVRQLDRAIEGSARIYASTVEQKRKRPGFETDKLDLKEFEHPDRAEYLQVWGPDGALVFRSSSLRGADLERFGAPIDAPEHRWVKLPNGSTGRAVGVSFTPLLGDLRTENAEVRSSLGVPPQTIILVLARDAGAMDEAIARLAALLACVGLATVLIAAGVLWWAIRESVRPMERLAVEIGRLGENDLSARVDIGRMPTELEPVREQLNNLMGRLERSFQRERTLSADLAHELRTPLAGLRATADVVLSRSRSPDEYREALGECLSIARQMQATVERLLSLFHLETGRFDVRAEQVWPDDFVRACWEAVADVAEERGLRVEWRLSAENPIMTDPDLLGLVVRNIAENAAYHSDRGGSVSIATALAGDRLELRVTNSGCTIGEDEAERVFDLLWRGDTVRSETGLHCGLGLPIVRKVVEVLGGSVEVRAARGGDFEIIVSIPSLDGRVPRPLEAARGRPSA